MTLDGARGMRADQTGEIVFYLARFYFTLLPWLG